MRKMIFRAVFFALIIACLFFSGCAGLVEKTGEALEGRAFSEKTTALYRNGGRFSARRIELREVMLKDGEGAVQIEDSSVPGLVITGSVPAEDGGFDLLEAHFLSSHSSGWNEIALSLIGEASLRNTDEAAVLDFSSPAERVQVSSGKIRLKNSRISGDEALRNLRNRRERILSLTEWMREKPGLPEFLSQKEFEDYWKNLLFPELVSKRKRPPEYAAENAEWTRAGGVKWNTTYTEFLFPEYLWEFRNSGALLRDWEEALSWIYLEYNWDAINTAFDGIVLKKIKGD